MTDYHCMYCDGVWEGSFNGDYLGRFADIYKRYGKTLEEVLKKDLITKEVCNNPECQEKKRRWEEETETGEIPK